MRKQPRQARSRATVDAIVEGAARVLGRGGWAAFNTNRVAETAGVGIGTMYQYFPDKLALVAAIRRRHFAAVLRALDAAANASPGHASRVARLTDDLLAAHSGGPTLHRALLDDAPTADAEEDAAFERAYVAGFERLLAPAVERTRGRDAATAARVLGAAVHGVTHEGARQGLLDAPAFRREVCGLLSGYLGQQG